MPVRTTTGYAMQDATTVISACRQLPCSCMGLLEIQVLLQSAHLLAIHALCLDEYQLNNPHHMLFFLRTIASPVHSPLP